MEKNKGVAEGGCPTLTSGGWRTSAHHSLLLFKSSTGVFIKMSNRYRATMVPEARSNGEVN